MKLDSGNSRLRLLPVHLVEQEDGVVVKRGALETYVRGESASETVRFLTSIFSEEGAWRDDVVAAVPPEQRAAVEALLDHLIDRRLLVSADAPEAAGAGVESELDLFYWSAGTCTAAMLERLNRESVTIIGVNAISNHLAEALVASGMERVVVVDFTRLRNERFAQAGSWSTARAPLEPPVDYETWSADYDPDPASTIVATSDFGGLHWMREWNEFCVETRVRFLPVVLQNMVGYVGPVVVPGETPCFECLRARQNANAADISALRAVEVAAFLGQSVNAAHRSMCSIVADIAAMELIKLHSGAIAPLRYAQLIEVRLLEPAISRRPVLRVPRCRVCSTAVTDAPVSIDRSTFLQGNRRDD